MNINTPPVRHGTAENPCCPKGTVKTRGTDKVKAKADAIAIALDDICLDFGDRPLFRDFSVSFPAAATTCLLGPSGIGKSTLLRIITGLQALPGGGSIRSSANQPLAGNIAYMAQDDLLLPWMTVSENITLGARLRGETITQQRLGAILRTVGLEEAADAYPSTLSGGMRQRTALARTLIEDRAVILMDEPFSAVDALTRMRLQDMAGTLFAGRTVILVTHDPIEALRLADHIYVLHGTPVQCSLVETPPGAPVRDPGSMEFQHCYAAILERLGRKAKDRS